MAKHFNDKISTCTKIEKELGAHFIEYIYVLYLNQQNERKNE